MEISPQNPEFRHICLLVLMLYIPINNFSVTQGDFLSSWVKQVLSIKCHAQGHS